MSRSRPSEQPDSAKPPPSFGVGALLDGKYRLERELGTGGMGAVFLAHHDSLDVDVAIKVVRGDLADAAHIPLGDRLLQEARAAAQLGHPAIARVFDFGVTPGGDPYLVMELLAGESLASVLHRHGAVKPAKAVQTILPIAHGLSAAHDKGIVHRDVKPENIFLAKTDGHRVQPKLIDFGVAKLERTAAERITLVGFLLGSPAYMSPEQARGEDVGASADVWALAVVLYEMLTGRLPFHGDNHLAMLRAIVEDAPPTLRELGVTDPELGDILERCLRKKREERFTSMADLGLVLARWLARRGYSADICGNSLASCWLGRTSSLRPHDIFDSLPPPSWPASVPAVGGPRAEPALALHLPAPARLPSFSEATTTRTSIPVALPTPVPEAPSSAAAPQSRAGRWLAMAALTAVVGASLGLAVGRVARTSASTGAAAGGEIEPASVSAEPTTAAPAAPAASASSSADAGAPDAAAPDAAAPRK